MCRSTSDWAEVIWKIKSAIFAHSVCDFDRFFVCAVSSFLFKSNNNNNIMEKNANQVTEEKWNFDSEECFLDVELVCLLASFSFSVQVDYIPTAGVDFLIYECVNIVIFPIRNQISQSQRLHLSVYVCVCECINFSSYHKCPRSVR